MSRRSKSDIESRLIECTHLSITEIASLRSHVRSVPTVIGAGGHIPIGYHFAGRLF
jgi:hypothetical protein